MNHIFDLLSDELDSKDNQQRVKIEARGDMNEPEDMMFCISVGSQEQFKLHKEHDIRLTQDEAKGLFEYLGRYFDTLPTQDVVGMLRKAADEIEKSAKPVGQ